MVSNFSDKSGWQTRGFTTKVRKFLNPKGQNADASEGYMQTVLVIDDEQAFLTNVEGILRKGGYTAKGAATVREGLALARSESPRLIISDVNLADGDGFSLLKSLRNDPRTATIPVILMTGMADSTSARHGMKLGADDFLEKPFKPQWLLETVAAQIRKRERILQLADQTKARLVAILEATPDLVSVVDAGNHALVYLNHAGRKMLGVDATAGVEETRWADVYTEASFEVIRNEALPAVAKEGMWRGESELRRHDGGTIPVWLLVQGHHDVSGEIEFYSTVAHNLTDRKEAEKKRQQVEVQLRHAQKLESIGQLAAGIAHEINTPTQFIGDNARFLQDAFIDLKGVIDEYNVLLETAKETAIIPEVVTKTEETLKAADLAYLLDEVPKAIEQTLAGVERVSKIVRAMKEFSHPGTDEMTSIDLNHAIESTVTVCRNEWKYVAELKMDLDPQLPPIPCLPGELNQVILNLVVNAAHAISDRIKGATDQKGIITILTRGAGAWVEIRVGDTGTGIPEHARDRIFDPFFTTKSVGKGTGQGLAIARSVVVDKHGGTIDFETELGYGTTFIIRLPINGVNRVQNINNQ